MSALSTLVPSSLAKAHRLTVRLLSSDADSDVLADYVIALIRDDDPEPQLRQNVVSNLEDFLKDSTSLLLFQCKLHHW